MVLTGYSIMSLNSTISRLLYYGDFLNLSNKIISQ